MREENRLNGKLGGIGVEGVLAIVSRALITSLSNFFGSMPERMSSEKLPRVSARSPTG